MSEATKTRPTSKELDWQQLDITSSRLTFVSKTQRRNKFGQLLRHFRCSCGNDVYIRASSTAKSCGCLKRDRAAMHMRSLEGAGNRAAAKALTRHGMAGTHFYLVYKSMMNRCYRASASSYQNYGARGIRVCERWHKFENFRDDMFDGYQKHRAQHMGEPRSTQLDRIDNDGNYEPLNCRWATAREQALNRRPRNGRV